jgi:hypothetical protein
VADAERGFVFLKEPLFFTDRVFINFQLKNQLGQLAKRLTLGIF